MVFKYFGFDYKVIFRIVFAGEVGVDVERLGREYGTLLCNVILLVKVNFFEG